MGDVDHLFGDDAGAGEFVLGDELAIQAASRLAIGRAGRHELVAAHIAIVLGANVAAGVGLEAFALRQPGIAHGG